MIVSSQIVPWPNGVFKGVGVKKGVKVVEGNLKGMGSIGKQKNGISTALQLSIRKEVN